MWKLHMFVSVTGCEIVTGVIVYAHVADVFDLPNTAIVTNIYHSGAVSVAFGVPIANNKLGGIGTVQVDPPP